MRVKRGWWTRSHQHNTAKAQDQRGGGGSPKATPTGVRALGPSPVWCVCGMRWVCVCVDGVVSDGKHHCGCVWLVACVSEWHGVGTTQHALVSVVVHVACVCGSGASTKSRVCVCAVVAQERWWWWWEGWRGGWWRGRHTQPTPTPPRTTMAPTTSPAVCVCVSGGHKGRGGGDHTPNHPCMRHACASRVCVCVVADESRWMGARTPSGVCVCRACGQ